MNFVRNNMHIALVTLISLFLIFYIRLGLPIPARDSPSFITTSLWIANHQNWFNPVALWIDTARPENSLPRYVYHGWLYPYLISVFAPGADWLSLFLTNTIFIIAGAFVYAFCLKSVTHSAVLLVSAVLIYFLSILSFSYRPEIISTFLIFIISYLLINFKGVNYFILGSLFALLFLCQPNSALVVAALYTALEFGRQKPKDAFISLMFVGAIAAALVAGAFILIYPFSVSAWLHGVALQAQRFSIRREYAFIVKVLVASPEFPLLLVFMAISGLIILIDLFRDNLGKLTWFSRALIAVIVAYMFFNVLRVPAADYNIIQFVPAFTYYVIYEADLIGRYRPEAKLSRLGLTVFIVFFGFVSACNLARKAAQTIISSQDQAASYEQSVARVALVRAACPDFAATYNVVFLIQDINDIIKTHFVEDIREMAGARNDAFIMVLNGTSTIPDIDSFKAIYIDNNAGIRLFGIPLSNSRNAYGVAIFVNENNHCDRGQLGKLLARE